MKNMMMRADEVDGALLRQLLTSDRVPTPGMVFKDAMIDFASDHACKMVVP